jgi:hypothetical protein
MKRSELKFTGDTYDLTPDTWGEEYIIVDEDTAVKAMIESFGEDFEDDAKRSETVEIAVDNEGTFYAVLEPYEGTSWGHKTGEWHNENMYRKCQNPDTVSDGLCAIYGKWDIFDDEEQEEK